MDLKLMHEALSAAHAEALADSRNQAEGFEGAACGPHLKHLAALAAAAAAAGVSADRWRTELLAQAGPSAVTAVDAAETCMRQSGLWPWNREPRTAGSTGCAPS